jgi:hypothetical protein
MAGETPWVDTAIGPFPDFARIYRHRSGLLTPRFALELWRECIYHADTYREDVEQVRDGRMRADQLRWGLPTVATRSLTVEFAARFARCFQDLAARVATHSWGSGGGLPGSTGEELALHVVLDALEDRLESDVADGAADDILSDLRDDPDRDVGFYRQVLFEDEDVLALYDPSLDGLEQLDEVRRLAGLANLHPNQWFLPFP